MEFRYCGTKSQVYSLLLLFSVSSRKITDEEKSFEHLTMSCIVCLHVKEFWSDSRRFSFNFRALHVIRWVFCVWHMIRLWLWDIYCNEIFVIVINSNEFGRRLSLYVCVGSRESEWEWKWKWIEHVTLFSHHFICCTVQSELTLTQRAMNLNLNIHKSYSLLTLF